MNLIVQYLKISCCCTSLPLDARLLVRLLSVKPEVAAVIGSITRL